MNNNDIFQWSGPGWYAPGTRSFHHQEATVYCLLDDLPERWEESRQDHDISKMARRMGLGTPRWFDFDPTEVITAAEVAIRFSLSQSTVRNAINRDDGSAFPSARKSAGTWLLDLGDAIERWGKPASMLLLSIFLATAIAHLPV